MEKHLIIIGGVAAGTKAAAKARRDDPNLKITLYTAGKDISYSACGIPYYVENLFENSNRLLVRSKEAFKEKENINILTSHKIIELNPDKKSITIENLETHETFEDSYSKLLIATGARPVIPHIDGIDANNIFTVRNIEDAKNIKKQAQKGHRAIIIGSGYIGLEMLEALQNKEVDTTVIELSNQIMPALDEEMAIELQSYLELEKNCRIITNDSIKKIIKDENNNVQKIETQNGQTYDADFIIVCIGVVPNSEIAKNAGLELGYKNTIKVNKHMQTGNKDIYAAGDCASQYNIITKKETWVPLGSTANKQGRVAAINITGGNAEFKGVLGSAVTKVFDFTVSFTGINEKTAKALNYDYEETLIRYRDKAGYMPGSQELIIKVLADKKSRKLLGAQIIGKGEADKRTNVIATALSAKMTVDEFLEVDLTYAPPFSPAIDPILTAVQVLKNKMDKKSQAVKYSEFEKYLSEHEHCYMVNASDLDECIEEYCVKSNGHKEVEKEPKDNKVFVFCEGGLESYIISQRLKEKGYKDVKFIEGGLSKCLKKKLHKLKM
ncbi:MAG: FAD-dependent oxidoreductase [Candidatus Gastranaerophilales bacterium]|nr:FAD-dependent oxidoreductase [Candidatus Gastranaerophilales bacterium]